MNNAWAWNLFPWVEMHSTGTLLWLPSVCCLIVLKHSIMMPLKTSVYTTHSHQEWGGFVEMNLSQLLSPTSSSDPGWSVLSVKTRKQNLGFQTEIMFLPHLQGCYVSSAGFPKVMGYWSLLIRQMCLLMNMQTQHQECSKHHNVRLGSSAQYSGLFFNGSLYNLS